MQKGEGEEVSCPYCHCRKIGRHKIWCRTLKKGDELWKAFYTTREIVDDYNHKAPDSLLDGNEVWVRKDDEVFNDVEDALYMLRIGLKPTANFKIRLEELEKLFVVPLSKKVKEGVKK